jgi:hypothetical protein
MIETLTHFSTVTNRCYDHVRQDCFVPCPHPAMHGVEFRHFFDLSWREGLVYGLERVSKGPQLLWKPVVVGRHCEFAEGWWETECFGIWTLLVIERPFYAIPLGVRGLMVSCRLALLGCCFLKFWRTIVVVGF